MIIYSLVWLQKRCAFEGLYCLTCCGENKLVPGTGSLSGKVQEGFKEVEPLCFLAMLDNWSFVC